MLSRIFETGLERLGRIIARQYNIDIIFEGNEAKTDGKTIWLPSAQDLSESLMKNLNGFLDHEVAHCKFTDFPQIKLCINRFHAELLNGVEDVRIEREMINEFFVSSSSKDLLLLKEHLSSQYLILEH